MIIENSIPVGTKLNVVEPIAIKHAGSDTIDTFGHGETLIFVGSDGITAQVRSPEKGRRYYLSHSILLKATAPSRTALQQPVRKPVPADLRGKRMT
jgi:hypothetical protein